MYKDNLARIIPEAPKSEPKARPRVAKAKKRIALPDPAGHKAKEAISALYPSVTSETIIETSDPTIADALAQYIDLGDEIKALSEDRDVDANRIRLAIGGNAGIVCGEYEAKWSEVKGPINYVAILTVLRAAHPEIGATLDSLIAEANAHTGTAPSAYRAKGHRALAVKRGAE